jgi:hypothetical protein
MDYSRYLGGGQNPYQQPLPPQAFDAPPGAFPPPSTQAAPPVRPMGPMPQVGEPGGFGVTMFRLADMVRRYGQQARQQQGRF